MSLLVQLPDDAAGDRGAYKTPAVTDSRFGGDTNDRGLVCQDAGDGTTPIKRILVLRSPGA